MLLPKIDRALDVPPGIQTLRVYLSRDVLGISGLLFCQHRLGSSTAMPHGLFLTPLGLAESAAQFGFHSPFDNWHQLFLKPAAHHRPQQLADKIFKGPLFATHWVFRYAALV